MLQTILLSGPGLTLIAAALIAALGFGLKKLIAFLAAHPKLEPLETLAVDAEKALADAVAAAEADLKAGKPGAQAALDASKAALADAKADIPDVVKTAEAEVNALLASAPTAATAPGGATVNLPTPIKGPRNAPPNAGIIPLIVAGLIALGVVIVGGITALVATGNAKQVLTCVEQTANDNAAGLGQLVSGLSTNAAADIESAVQTLGPELAKCVLLSLYDDAQVAIAAKAAIKQGRPVASAATIKAAAQVECVKRGFVVVKAPAPVPAATPAAPATTGTATATTGSLTN